MNNVKKINSKLLSFTKKYYTNELIKGILLFFCIGLLYFISTLLLEYFFWFSSESRTVLFWLFILVELFLFYKFIGISLFKLFGLKKGISKEDASTIIGTHFPEVNDKLINLLQLQNSNTNSELLLASIEQKANSLVPIPFNIAVNFKTNFSYLKYLLVPLLILFCIYISGNKSIIHNSYDRVLNYNTAYTPPAPFKFLIQNSSLNATENQSFILEVTTVGDVVPSDIKINFNNESYFLTKSDFNKFSFKFDNLTSSLEFYLESNSIISKNYTLNIINVPTILDFTIDLVFPKYLNTNNKSIYNTGNFTVPEGTNITWKLSTKSTENVNFKYKDSSYLFDNQNDIFSFSKFCFTNFNYQINTNNKFISDYETLNYSVNVIKDEYPLIQLKSKLDSLNLLKSRHFLGSLTDDYGLTKLELHYKNTKTGITNILEIPINKSNIQNFLFSFPGNISLDKDVTYDYFFRVFDNDAINKFKFSNSNTFTYNNLSSDILLNKQLTDQKSNLSNFSKSLKNQKLLNKDFNSIDIIKKENKLLNWNDKKNISNLITSQKSQQTKLKDLTSKMKNSLINPSDSITENSFQQDLLKRLSNQEKLLKKNEALLDELSKLQKELKDEDLFKKISALTKETQNQERSLEQILELTKRFYVNQKANKIANDLEKLSNEQSKISTQKDSDQLENQSKINNKFKSISDDLKDLQEQNKSLSKPMDFKIDSLLKNSIDKNLNEALKNILNSNSKKATKNQQSSSKQMQELSSLLKSQLQKSSQEQLTEDEKMLRQILDNLITFSFSQEYLIDDFKLLSDSNFSFSKSIKNQYLLKDNFHHIDDSLFALSLRNPKISDIINNEISDINFNMKKSISRFEDQKFYLGISNQQYVLTSSNNLANLLSSILSSIQDQLNSMSLPGSGSCSKPGGSDSGFQLSDIIQSQESLSKKLGNTTKGKNGINPSQNSNSNGNKSSQNSKGSKLGSDGEILSGQLYEIYKQQQLLKDQFKKLLEKNGLNNSYNSILKQFDNIENSLLDNGLNKSTSLQMNILKSQLLKLEKATLQQGQKSTKQSTTNFKEYNNTINSSQPAIKQYFNEVEFLNRQVLPLYPIYKNKVKSYFNNSYD